MKRREILALAGSSFFIGCVEEPPAVEVLNVDITEQNCGSGKDMAEVEYNSNNEVIISGKLHSEWVSKEIFVSMFSGSNSRNYTIITIESISSEEFCQEGTNSTHYNAKLKFGNMPPEIQVSHYVDGELSEGNVNVN